MRHTWPGVLTHCHLMRVLPFSGREPEIPRYSNILYTLVIIAAGNLKIGNVG